MTQVCELVSLQCSGYFVVWETQIRRGGGALKPVPVWKYICKCAIVFNLYRECSMWLVKKKINLKEYGKIKIAVKHIFL
jgi:hypothetical protein